MRNSFPRIQATLGLLSAASLLAVLTLLNVLIPAVAAARLTFAERKGWPSDALLSDLTLLTGTFASVLLAIGLLIIAALWLKRHSASGAARLVRPVIHGLLAVLVALTAILATPFALFLAYVVVRDSLGASPLLPEFLGLQTRETLAVWALLVLASLAARRVFVQYVGDVAAYVSPHVLDRFAELRKKIKDFVCDIGKAIYEQPGTEGEHLYDAVAIVGHSLGSVIAYDLLNRLIVEDTVGALPLPPMEPNAPQSACANENPPDVRIAARQDRIHLRNARHPDGYDSRDPGRQGSASDRQLWLSDFPLGQYPLDSRHHFRKPVPV